MTKKIGLGLSGGGFRATLYNLGSLIRLNELGILHKLDRITSVSGGSITAGVLAMNWHKLKFDKGVANNFDSCVREPLWNFCSRDFLKPCIVKGLLHPRKRISDIVARHYEKTLFKRTSFADIKQAAPQFLFYGTSLQTDSPIRMVDGIFYDWKIGACDIGEWDLARVVGVSSAFPPVLAPVKMDTKNKQWVASDYQKLFDQPKYKTTLFLADGGIYDNMGMEALWEKSNKKLADKQHPFQQHLVDDIDVCLIADAGAPLNWQTQPSTNWLSLAQRTLNMTIEQSRSLRKRWLIDKYCRDVLAGTYWGIATKIADYDLDNPVVEDNQTTARLKNIHTSLSSFSNTDKGQLINWGYALTDAAIRRHAAEFIDVVSDARLPMSEFPL